MMNASFLNDVGAEFLLQNYWAGKSSCPNEFIIPTVPFRRIGEIPLRPDRDPAAMRERFYSKRDEIIEPNLQSLKSFFPARGFDCVVEYPEQTDQKPEPGICLRISQPRVGLAVYDTLSLLLDYKSQEIRVAMEPSGIFSDFERSIRLEAFDYQVFVGVCRIFLKKALDPNRGRSDSADKA